MGVLWILMWGGSTSRSYLIQLRVSVERGGELPEHRGAVDVRRLRGRGHGGPVAARPVVLCKATNNGVTGTSLHRSSQAKLDID